MQGIKVYEGIGIGKAWILKDEPVADKVVKGTVAPGQLQQEKERFEAALDQAILDIKALEKHTQETVGDEEAMIFDAHLMMIQDPTLTGAILQKMTKKNYTADYAVLEARDEVVATFMMIEDDYLRARAKDVQDVSDKLLEVLLGIQSSSLGSIDKPVVLFAQDLKPSETVLLNDFVVGIVLEEGSVTSHAAIVAKAKGIPTVVGIKDACNLVEADTEVILDATHGTVLLDPAEDVRREFETKIQVQKEEKARLAQLKGVPAATRDGHAVKLFGNVGSLQETHWVKDNGGFGVGLLRTELIYMDSDHFPTEEEQYNYYKDIVEVLPDEVIIRTLDIGGDKMLPYYTFPKEMNPFLGCRAIRFCLNNEDLFLAQLKGILRASVHGKVKVMFPMVSNLEELRAAKAVLAKAKEALRTEGIPFNEKIQVGIMIEIPAAAIAADLFAKEVDFFSIGTNDLCQYTSAVDRMNADIAHLYQPLHPSILRLIKMTVDAANANGIEAGVCGEMAGDPDMALLLTGIGVHELSMSASMIPKVKDRILASGMEELKALAARVMETSTAEEALKVLKG
ncbi:phosphoenolpyruvate--protein phosphotransferase [Anaerotalea alkaliphila]|uniref:Phosphoenolpyruvate-protein phosphotransferase n=1 Tax=Anaerotalea alkaliphila TaxID=2662126 RepID=A0A7X5HVG1_9FIRM|nr:phosphoenolpyruvate--protein phosphotransferase [Anaerotalea alkaliphila]NDL67359.1 phosphoenolpyruvate--protein phosphotransferase [Anaerotalea alkaliphila]